MKVRVACACKRAGTLLDHPSFDMNDGLYFVGTVRPCDFTVCTPLSRLFGAHNSTNTRYLRRQKVLRVVVRSGFNGFSAVDALNNIFSERNSGQFLVYRYMCAFVHRWRLLGCQSPRVLLHVEAHGMWRFHHGMMSLPIPVPAHS